MRKYFSKTCGIVISDELLLLHLLWADDLILIFNTAAGLQTQLDHLFKYCIVWQLIANILKTKVLIFGEKRYESHDYTFTFNKQTMEIVKRYKYLGAIFSS